MEKAQEGSGTRGTRAIVLLGSPARGLFSFSRIDVRRFISSLFFAMSASCSAISDASTAILPLSVRIVVVVVPGGPREMKCLRVLLGVYNGVLGRSQWIYGSFYGSFR